MEVRERKEGETLEDTVGEERQTSSPWTHGGMTYVFREWFEEASG